MQNHHAGFGNLIGKIFTSDLSKTLAGTLAGHSLDQ